MSEESNIQLVLKYLNGTLSLEERTAFDIRLANDKNLQEEVRIQQHILNAKIEFQERHIRETAAKVVDEVEDRILTRKNPTKRIITALILLVTILILYFLYSKFKTTNNSDQIKMIASTEYSANIPYILDPKGNHKGTTNSKLEQRLENGVKLIRAKNYQNAIDTISLLLPSRQAHYYLGHTYFQKEDFIQSSEEFKIASEDIDLRESALFFLSLSYLSIGDLELFNRNAEKLVNSPFGGTIKQIKQKVNEIDKK